MNTWQVGMTVYVRSMCSNVWEVDASQMTLRHETRETGKKY